MHDIVDGLRNYFDINNGRVYQKHVGGSNSSRSQSYTSTQPSANSTPSSNMSATAVAAAAYRESGDIKIFLTLIFFNCYLNKIFNDC